MQPVKNPAASIALRVATAMHQMGIDGLPRTAIANPGEEALKAVLNPLRTDDLFFVADGTGGHAFAKTLPEHNANVEKWYTIRKERGDF